MKQHAKRMPINFSANQFLTPDAGGPIILMNCSNASATSAPVSGCSIRRSPTSSPAVSTTTKITQPPASSLPPFRTSYISRYMATPQRRWSFIALMRTSRTWAYPHGRMLRQDRSARRMWRLRKTTSRKRKSAS